MENFDLKFEINELKETKKNLEEELEALNVKYKNSKKNDENNIQVSPLLFSVISKRFSNFEK
jgi:predicted  nucleic acid-binding Zn-ribbon protein